MEVRLSQHKLKLRHRFTISRESHETQDTLIVHLSQDKETGYGETTSNPYYGHTVKNLMEEIEAIRGEIENYTLSKPEDFHLWLSNKNLSRFALCALDLAAHDLYGKLQNRPLHKLWNTTLDNYPTTNYTLGIDTIENMVAKMKEMPWPIYKIKLGTSEDLDIVRELREHSNAVFRIDANGAWTAAQTIAISPELKKLGVEFIEQPLKADDWSGMEQVVHHSVLPVIADESCLVEEDVERCALHFNGINIKLTKCGGLTPALRMIKKGRQLGLKIMVGCMTESTVGISAIGQLLPQLDYVDMDGPLLISNDIARGIEINKDATITFPSLGGSGIRLIK
ncbi:dipeptide epimerase [Muriicola soli]|uniref:Dipeptide epimerase n=1 Tax=Muriicola soli TaxID=2507538 RepID=A0A411E9X1_9FLAO|nr:dipeptide epimerase [Muriicola soli]QBA64511.1 dipeptide epimerase [Muriicola soli]